ncbi:MAG: hypothetical protein ABEN55_04635, partial [Bradymonadaceae bacterium]
MNRGAAIPCLGAVLLVLVGLVPSAFAAEQGEVPVPDDLQPWVDWVLYDHPDIDCPDTGDGTACAWPG